MTREDQQQGAVASDGGGSSGDVGSGASSSTARHIAVIELDDVVPRRVGDRPNLLVRAVLDPQAKVNSLASLRGRPHWARGHVVRLRQDLMDSADETEAAARIRLGALGFAVNRDPTLWRVYVLELEPTPAGHVGWVYVGETAIDVDKRIEQHVSGAVGAHGPLYAKVVKKHFARRRPDLEPIHPLFMRAVRA